MKGVICELMEFAKLTMNPTMTVPMFSRPFEIAVATESTKARAEPKIVPTSVIDPEIGDINNVGDAIDDDRDGIGQCRSCLAQGQSTPK